MRMVSQLARAIGAMALGTVLAGGFPADLAAQTGPPEDVPRAEIPRTPTGRPDMNGIWQALGNHHWDIERHQARAALEFRPGPIIPVPAEGIVALGALGAVPPGWGAVEGGEIPYLPEARAARDENRDHYLERDPAIKCFLPGVPRAVLEPMPFQIFQSEGHFLIAYEFADAVRDIYLEDPGPSVLDAWMGQSVGRWEDDTFVVEVDAFNGMTWFDRAGNHHSAALKVTERYTLVTPYHIWYEATMEDANTFTRPWTIRLPLYKQIDPNARLGKFKCIEFVEELMYGHLRRTPVGAEQEQQP